MSKDEKKPGLVDLLLKNGAEINPSPSPQQVVRGLAATSQDPHAVASLFLKAGVDINAKDKPSGPSQKPAGTRAPNQKGP
jgi:hypothetical protein